MVLGKVKAEEGSGVGGMKIYIGRINGNKAAAEWNACKGLYKEGIEDCQI